MGADASSASRTTAPASAPASGFAIDQKGAKRTGNPSAGPTGTVTPGGGAVPQSGQAADGTANRGKPTKDQKTFNESRSNNTRTTSPIVTSGTGRAPGAAAAATDDGAAQRASKINTSKSNLRTGDAPAERAPGSTSSALK